MHEGTETLLDACGLICPMPLLKTKQALNRLQVGDRLRVYATDAGSVRDFQTFAEQSGHKLLQSLVSTDADTDKFEYLIQKSEPQVSLVTR